MVLISRNSNLISANHRLLGEDCLNGRYVKLSPWCYIDLASVRDSVEEAYHVHHSITTDEYLHHVMTVSAVHNGYYFDSRVRLRSLEDPKIKMNIVTFLEVYGDELKVDPTDPPEFLTFDDLSDLSFDDDYLDYDCYGNDIRPYIPDETFENEVVEVVNLIDEDDTDIDGFTLDLEADETFDVPDFSILADILNMDP